MTPTLQLTQNADAGRLCPTAKKNAQKPLASSASSIFNHVKGPQGEKNGLFSSSIRKKNIN
ncbi:MAG: hypothetical protein ACI8XB_002698 [Patiriisocius sp.]|jgi:hypothetical protein